MPYLLLKNFQLKELIQYKVEQHSRLGSAENASGEDNAASGDENEASGEDHAASGDENYATADENDNVDGVEDIVDDEHIIDQVDVNMEGFRFTANSDERDTIRPQVNINEDDLEVIDYDEFESELDEDDIGSTRRAALRKLRKKVKERIKAYSVESRRNVEIVKNDNVRVRARCVGIVPSMDDGTMESSIGKRSDKGNHVKQKDSDKAKKGKNVISEVVDDKYKCQWSVYVAKAENGKWLVRTLNKEHICLHSRKVKHCTSTFLSKHVTDLVHLNPEIPIKALQDQMQKQFQVGISKHKAFRAKAKAEETLKGDAELQYGMLRDYVMELQKCNPNTTVKIDVYRDEDADSNTKKFRRIYVCLGALKDGFKAGGRDLIGLDGAFMKAPYEGQLLTAVSVDANNGIYPVAYGIVESESLDSWLWFLSALGDDLDLHINSNFTFITDRQKGLLPAIKRLFPSAEHRYCVRHICENMNLTWRGGAYKEMLWNCATATTITQFNRGMEVLKSYNINAYEWLQKIPAEHWSRSHFSGRAHCDLLINNICEVFNRQLLDARNSPIITCLEYVREYLMKRIVIVQNVIEKSVGPLTPSVTKVFNKIKEKATQYNVDWNGGDLYQVKGPYDDQVVVNLKQRICSCRKWEVSDLEGAIHIQDQPYCWEKREWPSTLIPPKLHPKIGRLPKKRKKSVMELDELVRGVKLSKKGSTITCSNCKEKGHTKRGCKASAGVEQLVQVVVKLQVLLQLNKNLLQVNNELLQLKELLQVQVHSKEPSQQLADSLQQSSSFI
ncbi:mutator type transposase [Tanacetum coccineum]